MNTASSLRIGSLAVACLVGIVSACGAVTPEEKMAEDLVWLHLKAPLPSLDHVNREEVLRILREIEAGKIRRIGNTGVGMRRAQVALLRIGDSETIRKALDTFRAYNSAEAIVGVPKAFEYAHSPALVAYLAEEFDSDESPEVIAETRYANGTPSGYVAPPRSIYAGIIAMRIILKDDAFSPELKAWAAEMVGVRASDPGEFRRRLQVWWAENRERFDAADYGSLVPLAKETTGRPPGASAAGAADLDSIQTRSVPPPAQKMIPLREVVEPEANVAISVRLGLICLSAVLCAWLLWRGRRN
jgi:hypothetical protein